MENYLYDFHRVVSDFLNFSTSVIKKFSSFIFLFFGNSIAKLKFVFFEVVIHATKKLLTVFEEMLIMVRFFNVGKYLGKRINPLFAYIVFFKKSISATDEFKCLFLNLFFQDVNFLSKLFDQF